MNDETALATLGQPPAFENAMPTAIALYLDDKLYARVEQVALKISRAQGMTPVHLLNKSEACFAVVSRAITWRLDPFFVAKATYQTPGGGIGFFGSLIHTIIESSGRLEPGGGGVRYEHYGDWSKVQGKFKVVTKEASGDKPERSYAMPTWTDDDARAARPADQVKYPVAQSCGVRVLAKLRGEKEARYLDFDLVQAQPRNSTLWATDPMTQICYTAVRRFGSLIVPHLVAGVPFDDGLGRFDEPRDVTAEGSAEIAMPHGRDEARLAAEARLRPPVVGDANANEKIDVTTIYTETGEITKPSPAAGTDTTADVPPAKKASQPQRDTIMKLAQKAGLTIAQLDEHLVATFGFGIDELPMTHVNAAIKMVSGLAPKQ